MTSRSPDARISDVFLPVYRVIDSTAEN